ncbi:MAG: AmmeMemoRadiSam system protein B [bacterium]
MKRKPAVAGKFYESHPVMLKKQIEQYMKPAGKKEKAIGIVVPHAGFMYSGKVAGSVYSKIDFPQTFVILGPNHTGIGEPCAIASEGIWETPLGNISVDSELAESILKGCPILRDDQGAHMYEWSLEVQLPFMQYVKKSFTIVPIAMRDWRQSTCEAIGSAIAKAVKASKKSVVIVASTDMTHYQSQNSANEKDKLVIDQILKLDPEKMLETVAEHNVTMCGAGPAAAMLFASKELGAKKAELTLYNTSGDSTGDYEQVVGYAGIIIS